MTTSAEQSSVAVPAPLRTMDGHLLSPRAQAAAERLTIAALRLARAIEAVDNERLAAAREEAQSEDGALPVEVPAAPVREAV